MADADADADADAVHERRVKPKARLACCVDERLSSSAEIAVVTDEVTPTS